MNSTNWINLLITVYRLNISTRISDFLCNKRNLACIHWAIFRHNFRHNCEDRPCEFKKNIPLPRYSKVIPRTASILRCRLAIAGSWMGAGGQCYLVRPSACKELPGTCAVIVKVNIYPSLYRYRSFDWVIGRCAEVVPKHRDCQARHWYSVQH